MDKKSILIVLILLLLIVSFTQVTVAKTAENKPKNSYFLQTSLLTEHWDNDPDTNNVQELIGLEYYPTKSKLYGLSYFKNSAFQSSWYLYKGRIFPWQQINGLNLYGKLTYGIITGYDDEGGRHDAVWYDLGTFPAALPSIGLRYKFISLELTLFANQGFIVHGGVYF